MGPKRCQHQGSDGVSDCTKFEQNSKNGTGVTGMCVAHGGGARCQHKGHQVLSTCALRMVVVIGVSIKMTVVSSTAPTRL